MIKSTALADQLEHRPVLRTAEVLEVVPGLVRERELLNAWQSKR
jgi:hypothetical protein